MAKDDDPNKIEDFEDDDDLFPDDESDEFHDELEFSDESVSLDDEDDDNASSDDSYETESDEQDSNDEYAMHDDEHHDNTDNDEYTAKEEPHSKQDEDTDVLFSDDDSDIPLPREQEDEEVFIPENLDEDLDLDTDLEQNIPTNNANNNIMQKFKPMFIPIGIGAILISFIGYRLIGSVFSDDDTAVFEEASAPGSPTFASSDQVITSAPVEQLPQPSNNNSLQDLSRANLQAKNQPKVTVSKEEAEATFDVIKRDVFKTQTTEIFDFEEKINKSLASLETQNKEHDLKISKIDDTVDDLNKKVNAVGMAITELTKKISGLNSNLETLNKDVGYLKTQEETRRVAQVQTTKEQNKTQEQTKTLHSDEYKIEAIIPGRVWLKDKNNITITVSEGETLGNMGKVLIIDAYKAAVVTSSGIVIR